MSGDSKRRRMSVVIAAIVAVPVAAVGVLAVYGGLTLLKKDTGERSAQVWTETESPAVPPPSVDEQQAVRPVMVNVISEPATGGDVGSTFCVTWAGSDSGFARDAVVLLGAPGYQCDAYLVTSTTGQVNGPYGVLYETPTECGSPGTYPAILENLWETSFYACLMDHRGA